MRIPFMNLRTGVLLAAFAVAGNALADGAFNQGDKRFVTDAANSGVYETQAAQVAVRRAQDKQVKAYAAMLLREHGRSNEDLRKLAASRSMDLPRELPHDLRGRVQGLEREKPEKFDREFIQKIGLDDHAKDIELFERSGVDAKDQGLQAFARKTLPMLRKHREQAQALLDKMAP